QVALYDLNQQQRYTRDLLVNYSEKKVFYQLNAEERLFYEKLKKKEEMMKNPTWFGIVVQNITGFVSKQFDSQFLNGFLEKMGITRNTNDSNDLLDSEEF